MKKIQLTDEQITLIQRYLAGEISVRYIPDENSLRLNEVAELANEHSFNFTDEQLEEDELYNTDTILWFWLLYVEQEKGNRSFDGMLMEHVCSDEAENVTIHYD